MAMGLGPSVAPGSDVLSGIAALLSDPPKYAAKMKELADAQARFEETRKAADQAKADAIATRARADQALALVATGQAELDKQRRQLVAQGQEWAEHQRVAQERINGLEAAARAQTEANAAQAKALDEQAARLTADGADMVKRKAELDQAKRALEERERAHSDRTMALAKREQALRDLISRYTTELGRV